MLLEDSRALAEIGGGAVPDATLADRELEKVLGGSPALPEARREGNHKDQPNGVVHGILLI